jgi:hypothetical protein
MRIVKFKSEHLDNFRYQEAQEYLAVTWNDVVRNYIEQQTNAWSVIVNDIVIFCGGFLNMGYGRALVWSLVSRQATKYMYFITKNTLSKFNQSGFRRLEMVVDDNFAAGHRWAVMLGFTLETPNGMPYYFLDKTSFLYGRIL